MELKLPLGRLLLLSLCLVACTNNDVLFAVNSLTRDAETSFDDATDAATGRDGSPDGANSPNEEFRLLAEEIAARRGAIHPIAWAEATEEELQRAGELLRRAGSSSVAPWEEDLAGLSSHSVPFDRQRSGFRTLATSGFGQLRIRWNSDTSTPSELSSIGFVRRNSSAQGVWDAFYELHRSSLDDIFAIGTDDLRLVGTENIPEFTVLKFSRYRDGVEVLAESFSVYISRQGSLFGSGVLWQISASWHHELGRTATTQSSWINAERARTIAGNNDAHPELKLSCDEAQCRPEWYVNLQGGNSLILDAVTGEELSRGDSTGYIGPVTIQGFPPGANPSTPQNIRFRGANVVNPSSGASLGWTSFQDGTHSFAGSTPVQIGLQGGVGSSTWPNGGVEFRLEGTSTVYPYRTTWTPSSSPSFSFGSPDVWFPNAGGFGAFFPHTSEIAYGWLSYWQSLMADYVYAEVPGTISAHVTFSAGRDGIVGNQARSENGGAPGSGQSTWGHIWVGAFGNDDLQSVFSDSIWTMAHEYGHTVIMCAATPANPGCSDGSAYALPSTSSQRSSPSAWRGAVHGAAVENMADFFGDLLTQYRYNVTSRLGVPMDPTWTYVSYDSVNDDFGTPTQDAAGGSNCGSGVGCPSGFACVPTDARPDQPGQPGLPVGMRPGLCARLCTLTTNAPCTGTGRGLICAAGLTYDSSGMPDSRKVCFPYDYKNQFFSLVGARLTMDAGWSSALASTVFALSGNAQNALRDFVTGSDNWYTQYLYSNTNSRCEVTRALRSVYSGTGFVIGDDMPNIGSHAVAVPVISSNPLLIWWGNGVGGYPNFEGYLDQDAVLFRGLGGNRYRITPNTAMGSTVLPYVYVYRWRNGGAYIGSGSSSTPFEATLPADDWYVAFFVNGSFNSGAWQASMQVVSGYDDFGSTIEEAYPMASGMSLNGVGDSSGTDAFQIMVPTTGSSLTISVSGPSYYQIEVFQPSGALYGLAYSSTFSLASVPYAGAWTWRITTGSVVAYSTQAVLGCASSGCDLTPSAVYTTARYTWGDRFAGRLPSASDSLTYLVNLTDGQHATFGLSHGGTLGCSLQMEMIAPTDLGYFAPAGQTITTWNDGAATGDLTNASPTGVGGHVTALVPGLYGVRVRTRPDAYGNPTTCPTGFRLFVAKSDQADPPMPTW